MLEDWFTVGNIPSRVGARARVRARARVGARARFRAIARTV